MGKHTTGEAQEEPIVHARRREKQFNLNSIFIAVVGFVAVEGYREIRATHDAVLNYGIAITDLRTRVTGVESRESAIEVEIIKLKDSNIARAKP